MKLPDESDLIGSTSDNDDFDRFREHTLEVALQEMRVRVIRRRRHRLAYVTCCTVVLLAIVWHGFMTPLFSPSLMAEIIHSEPLTKEELIVTQPDSVIMLADDPSSVQIIQSKQVDNVQIASEQELLALFAGYPVGLVERGLHEKKLVFLNPSDEKRFMVEPN